MTKLAYLGRCLAAQFSKARFACPNCGFAGPNAVVDRKYLVTQLRRCGRCKIMFRTPTDSSGRNEVFYEQEYVQGFTTDLPSDANLQAMMQTNFAGTGKSYAYYIEILGGLGLRPGASLFDYGCSWGYGSYQLAQAGFEVSAFEVAPTRRRYASEKLRVRTVDDMDRAAEEFSGAFDCFFSAHVLEHVPAPALSFQYAMRLLRHGGLFVSFTPNGSDAYRRIAPRWSKVWGESHPNFIDAVFLDRSFKGSPRAAGSSPVQNPALPNSNVLARLDGLAGAELFFAARKVGNDWG